MHMNTEKFTRLDSFYSFPSHSHPLSLRRLITRVMTGEGFEWPVQKSTFRPHCIYRGIPSWLCSRICRPPFLAEGIAFSSRLNIRRNCSGKSTLPWRPNKAPDTEKNNFFSFSLFFSLPLFSPLLFVFFFPPSFFAMRFRRASYCWLSPC